MTAVPLAPVTVVDGAGFDVAARNASANARRRAASLVWLSEAIHASSLSLYWSGIVIAGSTAAAVCAAVAMDGVQSAD